MRWVLAFCVVLGLGSAALAGGDDPSDQRMDTLFAELAAPETTDRNRVESQIWQEWSKSGSAAMDLLLQRGRKAMEAKDYPAAIEHLTALVDHAPDFAEGWNARATAYFQSGELGLSVEDIRHALALNPRHFGAMSGLATIFEELGYYGDALKVLEAVKAIHPYRDGLEDAIKRLERAVGGQTL